MIASGVADFLLFLYKSYAKKPINDFGKLRELPIEGLFRKNENEGANRSLPFFVSFNLRRVYNKKNEVLPKERISACDKIKIYNILQKRKQEPILNEFFEIFNKPQ